jgi:hypothetical protein
MVIPIATCGLTLRTIRLEPAARDAPDLRPFSTRISSWPAVTRDQVLLPHPEVSVVGLELLDPALLLTALVRGLAVFIEGSSVEGTFGGAAFAVGWERSRERLRVGNGGFDNSTTFVGPFCGLAGVAPCLERWSTANGNLQRQWSIPSHWGLAINRYFEDFQTLYLLTRMMAKRGGSWSKGPC